MRTCEVCGSTMPPFVARVRLEGDRLGCEGCKGLEQRSASFKNLASLHNPISGETGKHPEEWYHGSEHDYESFEDPSAYSPLQYEEQDPHSVDTSHWNTLLGNHFTSDHQVAKDFAEGRHSSESNRSNEPLNHVIHARLHIKNPKVYDSEHDMDQEVHEYEHGRGNTIHSYFTGEDEDDGWGGGYHEPGSGYGSAQSYSNDEKKPFARDDTEDFHPKAVGWLNHHPDKYDIAMRYKKRLTDQGYDGIVYGNEFEESRHGKAAKCAIAFDPDQIEITQHHYGNQKCLTPEEAKRRTPHPGQQVLPGTEHYERKLPEERRPDTSVHWPRTWTPSFFENRGRHASLQRREDTGRLSAPLPQECWDRYYGRRTAKQPHGEQSALNEMGQQDVYAVRSGDSMVNLCAYHRDVHVGNSKAADALGDQLGLSGRERSAETLGGARKGSCAACGKDTAYQLKLLMPRSMQAERDSRQPRRRGRPYVPAGTKPLAPLKQSENVRWASKDDLFHADAGKTRFDEDSGYYHVPAGSEVHENESAAWNKAIENWHSGRSDFPRVHVVHRAQTEIKDGKKVLSAPGEASELDYDHERHPVLRGKYDDEDEPVLFHGTSKSDYDDDPEEITPSGGGDSFGPGVADPHYAYATPSLNDAWSYAHKRVENGRGGKPTVYRVTPHDPDDVEKDPGFAGDYNRGNYEHDKRSKSGFAVLDEVPMSQKQEHDWRHSAFNDEDDDDWGESHFGVKSTSSREEPWKDIFPTVYGPEGTEPEFYGTGIKQVRHSQDVPTPLYHGTSSRFESGDLISPGHPGNFVRRMKHVYAVEDPEHAQRYGWHGLGPDWDKNGGNEQERHPRVYEVRPTGPYGHRSDAKGQNWASEHPWEVVREVWHHDPNEKKEALMKKLPTLRMLAHDATENQAIRHCPFCGGGKVIGRGDGTVECEFCGSYFTVQVQPQFPSYPQTIGGEPQQVPGMPGQVETPGGSSEPGGFPGDEEGDEGGNPFADDSEEAPGDDEDAEEAQEDEEPPPFAKKSSLGFRTASGVLVGEDDYMRHLAIRLAPDRDAMIALIREERRGIAQ